MPAEYGSVTPRVAAVATAASTALPPRLSTSVPICEATSSTVATAPPVPRITGTLGSLGTTGPAAGAGVGAAAGALVRAPTWAARGATPVGVGVATAALVGSASATPTPAATTARSAVRAMTAPSRGRTGRIAT